MIRGGLLQKPGKVFASVRVRKKTLTQFFRASRDHWHLALPRGSCLGFSERPGQSLGCRPVEGATARWQWALLRPFAWSVLDVQQC